MQLVYKTDDINEANRLCAFLVEKGIPSIVEEYSLRNTGSHIPLGSEIWMFVNSQYQGAVKLIDNPDHKVANPISYEEFLKFYKGNKLEVLGVLWTGVAKYGLTFIAAVVIGLIILSKLSS